MVKILYVADVHGSDICFRKFLNALKIYKVDVGILMGDLSGKMINPIVKDTNGSYRCTILGDSRTARTNEELEALKKTIASTGNYYFITDPDELEELKAEGTTIRGRIDERAAKAIIDYEMQTYYTTSLATTVPFFYGAQPNLGLYFRPDGAHPNPADLLPNGKIDEARAAQVDAAEQLREDMVYVGKKLYQIGCEAINFDTAGSAGDADFYATLMAIAELKKKAPLMPIEVGMSSEFVLGMHGGIEFNGKRLAGMYPHEQVEVAATAGANIFGPAVNVNTSRSMPWNLARAVTFVKHTVDVSEIPVHPNVGMGVCGVPMCVETPIDCVTRSSKSLVLIGKADGL